MYLRVFEFQSMDSTEVQVELPDMEVKVDDAPTKTPLPTSAGPGFSLAASEPRSAGPGLSLAASEPRSAGLQAGGVTATPGSRGIGGLGDLAASGLEENLNSSGDGNLDSLDLDLSMEADDLIQLVGNDFLGAEDDRDML